MRGLVKFLTMIIGKIPNLANAMIGSDVLLGSLTVLSEGDWGVYECIVLGSYLGKKI